MLRIRSLPSSIDKNIVETRALKLTSYQSRKRKRHGRNDDDEDMDGVRQKTPDPLDKLANATTLYVGNLYLILPFYLCYVYIDRIRRSFYTTEEQIHELFSKVGEIKRLVMGLDRFQKTPCGFCFVEYYTHQDALDCMKYIGGTKLDERLIRTDLDEGFAEGRQYGRGKSGGQVRDEYREEYDPGRGGYGRAYNDTDDMYR